VLATVEQIILEGDASAEHSYKVVSSPILRTGSLT
jgi:hypothetical protein